MTYSRDNLSWLGHFTELRARLIRVLLIFVVLLAICLGFVSKLYHYFIRPLTMSKLHLIVVSPGEIITVFLSIAGVVAIGLTVPILLFEVWRFVAPGLLPRERYLALQLLPFAALAFLAGLCFGWFLVFPMVLKALIHITEAQGLQMLLRAEAYFSFLSGICIPFGFVFELPLIVVFLTRIQVITPRILARGRRYAYVLIVVLGVLISPPELIAHLSVTVPMMLLYELSILLSRFTVHRRRLFVEQTTDA